MESSVFTRAADTSNEEDCGAYVLSTTVASSLDEKQEAATGPVAKRQRMSGGRRKDVVSLNNMMVMTHSLQAAQDEAEVEEKRKAAMTEEDVRRKRNERWMQVKARMSQRATPLPSTRSLDWNSSDDDNEEGNREVEMAMMHERYCALEGSAAAAQRALLSTSSDAAAITSRGVLREVVPWPSKVWHFLYNWMMYFVYAASMSPGVNIYNAEQPSEYYQRREFR